MVAFEAGLVLLVLVAVAKYAGVVKGAEKAYNLVLSGALLSVAATGVDWIAAQTALVAGINAIAPLSALLSLIAGIIVLVGGVYAAYKYLVA